MNPYLIVGLIPWALILYMGCIATNEPPSPGFLTVQLALLILQIAALIVGIRAGR